MARGLEYMERPPDMAANPVEQQPMQQAPAPRGGGRGGGSPQLIDPMEDLYVTGQDAEGNDLTQEYMNQVQELNRFVTMNAARGLDPTNPSNLDANNPEAARLITEFNQRKAQVDALGNELKQAQNNYTQVRDKQLEGKLYVGDDGGTQQGQIYGRQQTQDAARRQTERREVDDYIDYFNKNTPKTRAELEAMQRYYQSSKAAVDSLFAKGEIDRDEYNAMINLLPKPQDSLQVKETDSVTDTTKSTTGTREVLDSAARGDVNYQALATDLNRAFVGADKPSRTEYDTKTGGVAEIYTAGGYVGMPFAGGSVTGIKRVRDKGDNTLVAYYIVEDSEGNKREVEMPKNREGGFDPDRATRPFAAEAGQLAIHDEQLGQYRIDPNIMGTTMEEVSPLAAEMDRKAAEELRGARKIQDITVQTNLDDLRLFREKKLDNLNVGEGGASMRITGSDGEEYLVKGRLSTAGTGGTFSSKKLRPVGNAEIRVWDKNAGKNGEWKVVNEIPDPEEINISGGATTPSQFDEAKETADKFDSNRTNRTGAPSGGTPPTSGGPTATSGEGIGSRGY